MATLMEQIAECEENLSYNMSKLASSAYSYMQYYDEYQYETLKDPTLLKKKMKAAVVRVFNDDIQ